MKIVGEKNKVLSFFSPFLPLECCVVCTFSISRAVCSPFFATVCCFDIINYFTVVFISWFGRFALPLLHFKLGKYSFEMNAKQTNSGKNGNDSKSPSVLTMDLNEPTLNEFANERFFPRCFGTFLNIQLHDITQIWKSRKLYKDKKTHGLHFSKRRGWLECA